MREEHWKELYAGFEAPIARFDCGQKCAPFNGGVPACCDAGHIIPVLYHSEWQHLRAQSDLWRLHPAGDRRTHRLRQALPERCHLAVCKGHRLCERENRSLACRAFPFFPYLTREGEFLGLAYYWTYEGRCWMLSNLETVDGAFVRQFVATHERLFELRPDERENYRAHSASLRRVFSRWRRAIPLIHRDGGYYKVSPRSGRLRRAAPEQFRKHGPFRVAGEMKFAEEL